MENSILIEISPKIITSLIGFLISFYLIYQGWNVIKHGKSYLSPTQIAGLWILKTFQSPQTAFEKRREYLSAPNLHKVGIGMITMGVSFLFITILFIFWT